MQELPLQFKFRWLNDEGQEGLFARKKKGRFDGETLVLDDISISAHTVPPLTTIRQDMHKGARLLVDLLIRRLAGETVTSVAMTPELILRGTA